METRMCQDKMQCWAMRHLLRRRRNTMGRKIVMLRDIGMRPRKSRA
jgi:hypothetical protein